MTRNQAVIRGGYCRWKPKINKKIQFQGISKLGFISPWFIVVIFIVFAGAYLFFINSSATKGYQIRQVEKEISDLKKESERLRIKEAELKSLYHIEESSKDLNMSEPAQVSFIEEKSPVALK